MAGKETPVRELVEALRTVDNCEGNVTKAAEILDLKRQTLESRIKVAKARGIDPYKPEFSVPDLPSADGPVEEILDLMEQQYDRLDRAEDARRLIEIKVNIDGPFALVAMGDPHLDNRGCWISRLRRDVEIIQNTEGMFGGSVGDYRDNWVGRLAKLFSEQVMTPEQTLKVVEWFFSSVNWMFLLYGNHDLWSGQHDPLPFIHRLAGSPGILEKYDLRLKLICPNGREIFVRVRHDFPGMSQFNETHGHRRETLWGKADHIMMCGDRHHSGYAPIWNKNHERLCHAFRVGTYKRHDPYNKEHRFVGENWAPAMAAIVDPYSEDEIGLICPKFDLQDAADYLTYKRQKWKKDRR